MNNSFLMQTSERKMSTASILSKSIEEEFVRIIDHLMISSNDEIICHTYRCGWRGARAQLLRGSVCPRCKKTEGLVPKDYDIC